MKPTLVLKARELNAHALRIANGTGCCVVKGPVPNPTLVAHGLTAGARWHILTHEPPRRAIADLYVGTQAEAARVARLLATMVGMQLALLNNTATPADLKAHPRSITNPSRSKSARSKRHAARDAGSRGRRVRKAAARGKTARAAHYHASSKARDRKRIAGTDEPWRFTFDEWWSKRRSGPHALELFDAARIWEDSVTRAIVSPTTSALVPAKVRKVYATFRDPGKPRGRRANPKRRNSASSDERRRKRGSTKGLAFQKVRADQLNVGDVVLPPERELRLWMITDAASKGMAPGDLGIMLTDVREGAPDKGGRWLLFTGYLRDQWYQGRRQSPFKFKARPETPWPVVARPTANPSGAFGAGWRRAWAACLSGRAAKRPGARVAGPSMNPGGSRRAYDRLIKWQRYGHEWRGVTSIGDYYIVKTGAGHDLKLNTFEPIKGRRSGLPSHWAELGTHPDTFAARREAEADLSLRGGTAKNPKRRTPPKGGKRKAKRRRTANPKRHTKSASALARAARAFRTWQDRGPIPIRTKKMRAPKTLTGAAAELGKLVAVTYRSDKFTGKETDYEHDFSKPLPSLVTDPDSKGLHIVGGRYSITADGIRN